MNAIRPVSPNFEVLSNSLSSFAKSRCLSSSSQFNNQAQVLSAFFSSTYLDKLCSNVQAYFKEINFDTFVQAAPYSTSLENAPLSSLKINPYGISFAASLFPQNASPEELVLNIWNKFLNALKSHLTDFSLTDKSYTTLYTPIYFDKFESNQVKYKNRLSKESYRLISIYAFSNDKDIRLPGVYKALEYILDSLEAQLDTMLENAGPGSETTLINEFLAKPEVGLKLNDIEEALYQLSSSPAFYHSKLASSYMSFLRKLKAPTRAISLFERMTLPNIYRFKGGRGGSTLTQYLTAYTVFPKILFDSGKYTHFKELEEYKGKQYLSLQDEERLNSLFAEYSADLKNIMNTDLN